jgi:hypothetical protein
MKYAILLSVVFALAAPAFGAGTYYLLDEDWEAAGYWGASSPPAPWYVFYNAPADGNDWNGDTGYAPSGYAATLGWSPTEAPQVGDLLYTVVDLSGITLVPSEGDLLYLEWDQILDWFPGSYSGYASVRCLTAGYNTLEYFTWDGATHTGGYYVDLAAYAGATYFALSFNEYLTSSFGIDGWGVDNIVITHENFDPVSIKSASLGEIKALYRDQ